MGEIVITFFASYLIFFVLLSLVIWWLVDGLRDREMMAVALVSGVVAWLLATIFKDLMQIPRPFIVNGGVALTMTMPVDKAFPSVHTALLFALATAVWVRSKKAGFVYLLAALCVGVARVVANVHYPGDILGGAAVGIGVGWMVSRFNLMGWVQRLSGRVGA